MADEPLLNSESLSAWEKAAAKSAQQAGMVRDKLDRDTRRLLCL